MKNHLEESEKLISNKEIKETLFRYLTFYPFFIASFIICLLLTNLYLRYVPDLYETSTRIKILDKSMDSDMALPTAMTIFNRSTVNLENEKAVIKSRKILKNVVNDLNLNTRFFINGTIISSRVDPSEWLNEHDYSFNLSEEYSDMRSNYYVISFSENGMQIEEFFKKQLDLAPKTHFFEDFETSDEISDLPFKLKVNKTNISALYGNEFSISVQSVESAIDDLYEKLDVQEFGKQSDILNIKLKSENKKINEITLNRINYHFNLDGIVDRQLVFKRTIDFVDNRFELLNADLANIEDNKQKFKQKNELSYIESDVKNLSLLRTNYSADIFKTKNQIILSESLLNLLNEFNDDLLPMNIGIENKSVNELLIEYNRSVISRNKFSSSAGVNNQYLMKLDNEISLLSNNIINSIESSLIQLNLALTNLEAKQDEYNTVFLDIPENEKLLRAINREQTIKESLFLLLLQKKEEAAINYAVTKPSIKIVDVAISTLRPVSPNKKTYYLLSLFFSQFLPFIILYIRFTVDTKIHTRNQLSSLLPEIPILGEVPVIDNKNHISMLAPGDSRSIISESVRMILANMSFTNIENKESRNVILVTSSVKGEGKTLISANVASILASKNKTVLLLGADLRNPQLHKLIDKDKSVFGLSDFIHKDDIKWSDLLIKNNGIDILLSGTIPPNPTKILSSKKFGLFLDEVKNIYDYVIIDSAPCLLVSDTFEISKFVGTTLYMVRSNYTDLNLTYFIDECAKNKKLKNISIVLNCVGGSSAYGYKYGYQYGYRYGYKYGYNYGYGYGYGSED